MTIPVLHIQKIGGIAGSENHLLDLLPRLPQYGFSPTMVIISGPHDRPEIFTQRLRDRRIPFHKIDILGDCDISLLWRLGKILRSNHFPLVHTHLIHGDLYGLMANRLFGNSLTISSRHNDDPHWTESVLSPLYRTIVRSADHFICISEHLKSWLCAAFTIPEPQASVVHYGLSPRSQTRTNGFRISWNIPEDAPLIGIVARFCEQKGHDILLKAMPQVLTRFPTSRLALVGFGPLERELRNLTSKLGLDKSVVFTGEVREAHSIMHEFDVFVHPSRWEGFGLVFLEAMVAGTPVIATKVSAIPEIVKEHETGLLVPPDDSSALATAIIELLANPSIRRSMGHAAIQRVQHFFSPDTMAQKTAYVYKTLLSDQKGECVPPTGDSQEVHNI